MEGHDSVFKYENFAVALAETVGDIMTSGISADVTIASSDGRTFRAHKFILVSASVVFEELFLHNSNLPLVYFHGILFIDILYNIHVCCATQKVLRAH